jgi:hypothetical protein
VGVCAAPRGGSFALAAAVPREAIITVDARMLTALLADIHANFGALEACLRHAREHGAERFASLGDLVGYGPDPAEVIETILTVPGAIVLKGKHDEAIEIEPKVRDLNDVAYAAIAWTRTVLSEEQQRFLSGLPLIAREGDTCYVHASAKRPEKWTYVEDANAASASIDAAGAWYVFSEHVHEQKLCFASESRESWLISARSRQRYPGSSAPQVAGPRGSAGQPRDGNPAASYALFDGAAHTLTFFRIPYDPMATASRIRAAGLPALLAERIERGL